HPIYSIHPLLISLVTFVYRSFDHLVLHSFPTRRSSDLSVLVIRLRSLRLLRVSGIVMRLRMFLLLITFLKASHSYEGDKQEKHTDRKSGSAGMPRPISYAVFCLKKKNN